MKPLFLILAAVICCSGITLAQHKSEKTDSAPGSASPGDLRVREGLNQLSQKFVVDADGDFKIIRDTTGGRTQVAWIISKTNTYGGVEIREIISPAFKTSGHLSAELATRLLKENNKYKIGFWRLVGEDASQAVFYASQIPATIDAQSLDAAIKSVTMIADAMEKEQVGTDDF